MNTKVRKNLDRLKPIYIDSENKTTVHSYLIDYTYSCKIENLKQFCEEKANKRIWHYQYFSKHINGLLKYIKEDYNIENLKNIRNNKLKIYVCDMIDEIKKEINYIEEQIIKEN
jgi:hypothetical protein